MRPRTDITGQRFGRLVAIQYIPRIGKWLCQCDCGNYTESTYGNLNAGRMVSCGCKKREQAACINASHGYSGTRLYRIWYNMRVRARNPKSPVFSEYGGRGIGICDEWSSSFENFALWAERNGYREDLTIDRIDNDRGYYPDNCRWVTMKVQANNRRAARR